MIPLRRAALAAALVSVFAPAPSRAQLRLGIDVLLSDSVHVLKDRRVGLITNHSGRDAQGRRDIDLLFHAPGVRLVALFGPEHGISGVVPGGDKISAGRDSATGLPVYSLYGETRVPTPEMLKDVDVLLYDIQDIGARTYTFVWTMALAAEAANKLGKKFIVLDRPNPIRADRVEGGVLEMAHRSFVGQFDVALRYGLTPGELLLFLAGTGRIAANNIAVIPMSGYKRSMWYADTRLPWINPSPNIRDAEAALLYPGTVFFEGTNLSEGRGTDAPLKQVGAPWLTDAAAIARAVNDHAIPGIRLDAGEATVEEGQKHGGKTIPVVRFHVTDPNVAKPVAAAVWLMREIYVRHTSDWRWQTGGIERLAGTSALRAVVEQGDVASLLARWREESAAFERSTLPYQLYR